jgi:hypothetical protein
MVPKRSCEFRERFDIPIKDRRRRDVFLPPRFGQRGNQVLRIDARLGGFLRVDVLKPTAHGADLCVIRSRKRAGKRKHPRHVLCVLAVPQW